MYQIGFLIYVLLFRIVAVFHPKAGKMVKGHRQTWKTLRTEIGSDQKWLWFHAASLGEFEQGRPVMEKIRASYPEYKILLTFYSPSGYEVRKNYTGADLICYLPFDTCLNARRFLKLVNPVRAFFIKYEFWPNYLYQLKKLDIPTYLISGIFRPNQLFFKSYGGFYRRLLNTFNHLFVQNQESISLLKSIGRKTDVSITGDTRFDRVLEIKSTSQEIPVVEAFRKQSSGKTILIAGSSWPKDEEMLLPYFNNHPELKLILAPHQIHEPHLQAIESKLKRPFKRLSKSTPEDVATCDCLIIDGFGLLSSIYRYGDIAYIGGGFGIGIHNTLEAAVYGIPVLFGPNHAKFQEAKDLIAQGGAQSVQNQSQLIEVLSFWLQNANQRVETGRKAGKMVLSGSGGTEKVCATIPL
jgi:3-deoxy-D-manno-octulosonic-acid transferase